MCAIFDIYFYRELGIEAVENALCNVYSGEYSFLFYHQFAFAYGVGRYATKSCMVAIANIFAKGEVN